MYKLPKTIGTVLHRYRFDVSRGRTGDQAEYGSLCARLRGEKGRGGLFNVHAMGTEDRCPAGPVQLETSFLFSNQWNTGPVGDSEKGFRVFDWYEGVYPNANIKNGHYLDITEEMRLARHNMRVCGYCRAFHQRDGMCDRCLDSEYLKKSDLKLLRLNRVLDIVPHDAGHVRFPELTSEELAELLPRYKKAQTYGAKDRAEARIAKQRSDIETRCARERKAAQDERDGMIWLLNRGINISNVIFYDHKVQNGERGVFCFGWRNPLGPETKSALADALGAEFPFPYEYKETS